MLFGIAGQGCQNNGVEDGTEQCEPSASPARRRSRATGGPTIDTRSGRGCGGGSLPATEKGNKNRINIGRAQSGSEVGWASMYAGTKLQHLTMRSNNTLSFSFASHVSSALRFD